MLIWLLRPWLNDTRLYAMFAGQLIVGPLLIIFGSGWCDLLGWFLLADFIGSTAVGAYQDRRTYRACEGRWPNVLFLGYIAFAFVLTGLDRSDLLKGAPRRMVSGAVETFTMWTSFDTDHKDDKPKWNPLTADDNPLKHFQMSSCKSMLFRWTNAGSSGFGSVSDFKIDPHDLVDEVYEGIDADRQRIENRWTAADLNAIWGDEEMEYTLTLDPSCDDCLNAQGKERTYFSLAFLDNNGTELRALHVPVSLMKPTFDEEGHQDGFKITAYFPCPRSFYRQIGYWQLHWRPAE
jgi:hypothetical protein